MFDEKEEVNRHWETVMLSINICVLSENKLARVPDNSVKQKLFYKTS